MVCVFEIIIDVIITLTHRVHVPIHKHVNVGEIEMHFGCKQMDTIAHYNNVHSL